MSGTETLTINVAVQGAQQASSQISGLNSQLGATQSAGQKAAAGHKAAGDAAQTAAQHHTTFRQNLVSMAGGFSAATGGALELYSSYQRLEMATLGVQRADTMAEKAKATLIGAQLALQKAIQKYGADSPQAEKATIALKVAEEKVAQTAEKAKLKHDELNTAYAEFAQRLGPAVLEIGGGVVT